MVVPVRAAVHLPGLHAGRAGPAHAGVRVHGRRVAADGRPVSLCVTAAARLGRLRGRHGTRHHPPSRPPRAWNTSRAFTLGLERPVVSRAPWASQPRRACANRAVARSPGQLPPQIRTPPLAQRGHLWAPQTACLMRVVHQLRDTSVVSWELGSWSARAPWTRATCLGALALRGVAPQVRGQQIYHAAHQKWRGAWKKKKNTRRHVVRLRHVVNPKHGAPHVRGLQGDRQRATRTPHHTPHNTHRTSRFACYSVPAHPVPRPGGVGLVLLVPLRPWQTHSQTRTQQRRWRWSASQSTVRPPRHPRRAVAALPARRLHLCRLPRRVARRACSRQLGQCTASHRTPAGTGGALSVPASGPCSTRCWT